jgi:hypothetical protein
VTLSIPDEIYSRKIEAIKRVTRIRVRLRFTASGYPFGHCTVLSVRLRFTASGYPFGHCTVLSVRLRFTTSGYPFGHFSNSVTLSIPDEIYSRKIEAIKRVTRIRKS